LSFDRETHFQPIGQDVTTTYDSILFVSFGGPEGPDDVLPFLENVLRGKNVPRERVLEVAHHYEQFGGVSPINAQNRALIAALERELGAHGPRLPVYFGNRNWHPLLPDTLRKMANDGKQHALAFITSAYSSYSGCRQYRENIAAAQQAVGQAAPRVDKLRMFFNHPGFIAALIDRVNTALERVPVERREAAAIIYTAHSIPQAMANGCSYVEQLNEAARLVSAGIGRSRWRLVYQSRSGPPSQPWLGPDICDHLRAIHAAESIRDVVIAPIGFLSDHIEILYDLDTEARAVCEELGMHMERAATVGSHPRFVSMIRELIVERMTPGSERPSLGTFGPSHDVCPSDCCLSGRAGAGAPGRS
jgi:protoporphyrin/coproporphyrin ferrochelatase